MRKSFTALVLGALVLALSVGASVSGAAAEQSGGKGKADERGNREHNLKGPFSEKQDKLREKALAKVVKGKAGKKDKVIKIAPGQFVQYAREGEDKIFVVLAEFGNTRHSAYCDPGQSCLFPPDGSAQRYDGPLHNQIPQPDRSVDNTTLWQADYNRAHYEDMYFNRMAKYYETQSSGRYSVNGDVTEWVRVPFNEARYGRDFCGGIVCNNTWFLIRDALAFYVQNRLAAGDTLQQITDYLKTFDVQDRYDFDGDGNFAEPDGFIDHFQIVHAGGDQAAGDPLYGSDAIWSHRWYAQLAIEPVTHFPGVQVGQGGASSGVSIPNNPTGVWVGDYTIQPENGGLGVFAHEFGHDLGLPDLYDTSGNTGGAENSTGFWTLMSSGANIGDGGPNGIGDDPVDLGAWEKLQLGWLDYDVAFAGKKSEHKLGPAEHATKAGQALIVVLPQKEVPLALGAPCAGCGSRYFYSGAGDDLTNTMTKSIPTLTAATPLTAKVRYEIEEDWDYAYLQASSNAGTTWTNIQTNLSRTTDPNGQNQGFGITGSTGGSWVDLTATLPAGTNAVRFAYVTDGFVVEPGFQIDNVAVGGNVIGTAETENEGWTFVGFRTTTGSEIQLFANYYIAENRQYISYDRSLRTAYNFGFLNTRPDWVEHFPYQNGLLINYWDTSQSDNNVGDHPGEGLVLPIDAHPDFWHWYDGHLIRPRILTFDSTFGLEATDAITVHKNGNPTTIPSRPAVPVFDDTKDYWFNCDQDACTPNHPGTGPGGIGGRYQPGWYSVRVPKTGTTIRVKNMSGQGTMQVQVAPK